MNRILVVVFSLIILLGSTSVVMAGQGILLSQSRFQWNFVGRVWDQLVLIIFCLGVLFCMIKLLITKASTCGNGIIKFRVDADEQYKYPE